MPAPYGRLPGKTGTASSPPATTNGGIVRHLLFALLLLAADGSGAAAPAAPAFDPTAWKGRHAGPSTDILTLGSPHLSTLPAPVDAALVAALLDRLAAWRPDTITVEGVAGEECETLQRYAGTYPDSFGAWCRDPAVAQRAIGEDLPTAAAEIHRTLRAWPAAPAPAARRHLAALFLAAGEAPSAVVQWRRLPEAERHAGDGVVADTLPLLERVGAKPNETYDIGVALAVRLGLERVYLVDDHTADGALPDEGKAFEDAIAAAWRIAPSRALARERALEQRLRTGADLLALFRFMNQPDTLRQNIRADFGAALGQASDGLFGRRYVAAWEVRNLRMVANIRAAIAARPGARVLNVVGSTHKPYYDSLFGWMPDVRVIDADSILR
jgi:hypothetical protein